MKNKKGQFDNLISIFFVVMIFLILVMMALCIFSALTFENRAEEKCNKIGLDLFDYEGGSMFTSSSITCINDETKEITKIR